MRKLILTLVLCIAMLLLLPFAVAAEAQPELPSYIPDISELEEHIPPEIREMLPDDVFDGNTASLLSGLNGAFFLNFMASAFGVAMGNVAGTFFTIIGLILITACITAMKDSFKSEGAGKIIEWATVIITAVIVYTAAFSQFALLQDMLTRLHGLLTGLLPFITALNIASGSVTTAAVTGVQITLVLAIISSIAYYALLPILQVCFGLNLTSHVSKSHGLTLISDFVRNGFLFLIGGITAVLGIIFAFQANVAQSADTVALRTMKFAAGSWIPVVGSSVSEALRTVMGSLNLIRSTTGAIGIVSVLMIGLPTILSLAAAKLSFTFAAGIAEMLSCGDVAKMLGGVNKLLNFAIAIAVIFNVMTIFSLGVFMGSVG